jgi:hypothetical protein
MIFSADRDPDSAQYMSVIFPMTGLLTNKKGIYGAIKDYLKPVWEQPQMTGVIGSITSNPSKFLWENLYRPPHNSSDYSTQLYTLTGTSENIQHAGEASEYRIKIYRKLVVTGVKETHGMPKNTMIVCEEAIIQLQYRRTVLTSDQDKFRNTRTCLVLSARIQLPDTNSHTMDHLHVQSTGALSMVLKTPAIKSDIITKRSDDSMMTFGWLAKKMSDPTSNKPHAQIAATKMFGKLMTHPSVIDAAKGIFKTKVAIHKRTSVDKVQAAPDNSEILRHSFIAHTKAFMLNPKSCDTSRARMKSSGLEPSSKAVVQRLSVVEWFTTPSFAFIVVSLQGGEKPLLWVFTKSYCIRGTDQMTKIFQRAQSRASDDAIAPSIEKPPPAQSHFTPLPPPCDFTFDRLAGCSTLPEELELELELL